jgi:hypothetical protein
VCAQFIQLYEEMAMAAQVGLARIHLVTAVDLGPSYPFLALIPASVLRHSLYPLIIALKVTMGIFSSECVRHATVEFLCASLLIPALRAHVKSILICWSCLSTSLANSSGPLWRASNSQGAHRQKRPTNEK